PPLLTLPASARTARCNSATSREQAPANTLPRRRSRVQIPFRSLKSLRAFFAPPLLVVGQLLLFSRAPPHRLRNFSWLLHCARHSFSMGGANERPLGGSDQRRARRVRPSTTIHSREPAAR